MRVKWRKFHLLSNMGDTLNTLFTPGVCKYVDKVLHDMGAQLYARFCNVWFVLPILIIMFIDVIFLILIQANFLHTVIFPI